ncbi:hypothetical protein P3447_08690 [Vibrio parahaemolyticus]|nr:hypothetical protein [Vibrio parahaemolyticus]
MESKQIEFPKWWLTALFALSAVVSSQLVMLLDNARGVAYIIVPILIFFQWMRKANIRWTVSRKAYLACFALIVVYGIGAELVLVQIISIEHGAPIISSGSIYEVTKCLARI